LLCRPIGGFFISAEALQSAFFRGALKTTEFGTHQHNKQLSANAVELICHFLEAKVMEKTMLK
jgi:hypothetical protein